MEVTSARIVSSSQVQLQRRDFKTFVVYLVEAHLRVGSEQVGVCLFRRYREFWALDRILSRRYSLLSPIPFPEKHAFGNTSKKTISERTEQLQLYLDTILKNPAVASDDLVLNFFCAVSDRRLAGTSIFTAALVGRAPQACLGLSLRACALNTPTHQPAQRGLADLPMPLLVRVMSCLGPRDITEAARVCRKFYTAASHYFVWRKLAADMGCDLRITTNKIFGTGRNGGILGDRDPKHALLRTLKVDAAVRHSYQLNSYHVRCLCSSKKLFGMMFGPAADALKRRLAPAAKDPFGDVFTGQSQPSSSSPSSLSRDKIGGGGDRNDGGGSGTSGGGQFDGYDDTGEDGEEGQASVEDALNPQPSAVIAFGIAQSASLMSDAKDFYTESDTTNGSSIDSGTVGYDLSNSSGGGVGDSGGDDSDNSKDVLTGTTTNRNFSAEYKKSRNARKDKKRNGGSNYAADGGDDYYDGSCDCDGVCEDSAKDDVRHSHLPPHTSTVPSLGSGKDGVSGASHRVRAQFFNVHTPGQPGAEEVKGFCFTLCVQSECRMTPFTQHFLLRSNFVILAFYQTDTSERLAQLERLAAKVHALCPTMPVFLVSVPPPVSAAIPGILKDIAARGRSRAAAAAAAIGRLESLAVATGAVKAYDLGLVKRSGGEASYVIQDIAAHLAPHLRDPAPEFTTVETCLTPQAINNDLPAVIHKIDALYVNMGEALAADSSGERRPLRSTVAATGAWIRSLEEAWGHDNAAPSSAGTAVTQRQGVFDPDFGKIAAVLLFGARNFFLQQLRRISIDKTIEYLITSDDSVAERFATVKEYLANIVRYTHASALWKGSPAADRHRVQCEIETYFFERVYKIIFPIVSEDKNADRAIWRKIHALRTIHPAQLRIKREFWNYDAWQAAIDELIMINYVVTPYAKTKCIANCSEVLINSIQEQTSLTEANADNFLPQLIYVLIKANPAYLKTNLAYITAFNTMGATETQYYKASLEIAVGFIDQLDDAGIEGLLKSPVEKEWLQATPKKSNKAPALSLAKHAPSSSSSSSSSVSPVSSPGSSFPPSKATFAAAPDFDEAAVTSPGCASTMTTAKKISSPEPVTTATTRLTHLPSSPLPPPSSLSRRITTASTVAATSSPNEKYFIMLRKSCKANLVFDYRRGGGKDIKTGPRKVARPSTAKELGLGEAPSYPPTVPPGILQGSRPKSSTSLSDSTWEPGTLPLIKQYNKRKTFLEKTAAPCTSEPSSRRSSSAVKDLTKSTSVALSSSSSSSSTVSRTGSGSGISSGYADYDSDNYDDDDDEDEEDDISEDDDTDSVEAGFGKDSKTFSEKSIASGTPAKQSKQKPSK